jgi:hypothetical protein
MLPKEVCGIRFLEMYPEFFEPFIQFRIDEAYGNLSKSEEYHDQNIRIDILSKELLSCICKEQKKIFLDYDAVCMDLKDSEIRACYITGLQDGIEYAKGKGL